MNAIYVKKLPLVYETGYTKLGDLLRLHKQVSINCKNTAFCKRPEKYPSASHTLFIYALNFNNAGNSYVSEIDYLRLYRCDLFNWKRANRQSKHHMYTCNKN